ncbi:unnamed protein product, partial [Prorocentrum cordatum]
AGALQAGGLGRAGSPRGRRAREFGDPGGHAAAAEGASRRRRRPSAPERAPAAARRRPPAAPPGEPQDPESLVLRRLKDRRAVVAGPVEHTEDGTHADHPLGPLRGLTGASPGGACPRRRDRGEGPASFGPTFSRERGRRA